MKYVFRNSGIIFLIFAAALAVSGCAKHPKNDGAAPPPAPALTIREMREIVVARVNGVDLRMDELQGMINHINARNRETSTSESPEQTRKRALEQLILQELALQEAARQGLTVDEGNIDKAMEMVIKNLGHEEGYNAFLAEQQITPAEMREMVERSLLTRLIFAREVLMKVSVSDDDVRKEYDNNKDKYVTQDKQMSFEEARDLIEGKLKADAQKKRREEWEQELKKDAKIEIVEEAGSGRQKAEGR